MNEEVKPSSVHIHSRADELIACLEGEIAKRDAIIYDERIDADLQRQELDAANSNLAGLRTELAALKAQEPVARLPACPSRAFAVANLRDLAQSVLQHDPDVGMFRDEDQAFLINELADLAESFNGDVKLYAAPVSEAKAQGVVMPERSNERGSDGELTYEAKAHNRCLDAVARLNAAPAAPAADAWIPISERLPIERHDPDGVVVVITSNGDFSSTATFFKRGNTRGWRRCEDCISHWMPLPSAHRAKGVV